MDHELRKLKESLDETVLKDMEMTKALKRKILKKGSVSERIFPFFPQLKIFASVAVAGLILVILGYGFLQQEEKTNQASQPAITIQDQQVALIRWQEQLISVMQPQAEAENQLIAEDHGEKRKEVMEGYRTEIIEDGEETIQRLKKLEIPSELSIYEKDLRESLKALADFYQKKSDYYRGLNLTQYSAINKPETIYYYKQSFMGAYYKFEARLGEVYKMLGLGLPNYDTLTGMYDFSFNK